MDRSSLSCLRPVLKIEPEIVGQFIDACVDDHAEAKRLLNANPGLRRATWLGGERIVSFLAIEHFPAGVRFCIQNGFDPNKTNCEFGTTPLHYACKLNYTEVALALLENGANPNAQSEIDDNPLHCCIQNGNSEILELLISHGADARYTTDLNETIFDRWPNDAEKQSAIVAVLDKHNIKRDDGKTMQLEISRVTGGSHALPNRDFAS